jgi:hypothetical protein
MANRWQFRLRTLFYATAVAAVACAIGLVVYEWLLPPEQRQRRYLRSLASVIASPTRELAQQLASTDAPALSAITVLGYKLAEQEGDKAIPTLIGMIEADNSYATVYGVGYHQLYFMTGVGYSPLHDGAWWRRWWQANQSRFPSDIASLPIPVLPKTEHGLRYHPFPADIDTLQGKLRLVPEVLAEVRAARSGEANEPRINMRDLADEIARHYDPHAIPYLLALAEVDEKTAQEVANALRTLTGLQVEEWDVVAQADAGWWRRWWAENKTRFAADVQAIESPDFTQPLVFAWKEQKTERCQEAEQKALLVWQSKHAIYEKQISSN